MLQKRSFFAVHYTSASTLFETFGYFLRIETSRLGGELHSESSVIYFTTNYRLFKKSMLSILSSLITQQLDGSVVAKSYFAFIIFKKK